MPRRAWSVYAWPNKANYLDAEWGDMIEIVSDVTFEEALERATELGLSPIGI